MSRAVEALIRRNEEAERRASNAGLLVSKPARNCEKLCELPMRSPAAEKPRLAFVAAYNLGHGIARCFRGEASPAAAMAAKYREIAWQLPLAR